MAEDLEQRIVSLETHVAEQEKTIQDLSDVLAEQWKQIQALNGQLDALKQELEGLEVSHGLEIGRTKAS